MAIGDASILFGSASTNGRPIAIAATATPGTLLHTAVTGTDSIDAVTVEVSNTTAGQLTLTIEFGGTSSSDHIEWTIPRETTMVVLDRARINNGLAVRAFCASAGLNARVEVDRYQTA